MLISSIKDGTGSDKEAKVGCVGRQQENALSVNVAAASAGAAVPTTRLILGDRFRSFLWLNGDGTTKAMNVDGTTPKTFSIILNSHKDIIINEMSIFAAGGTISLTKFFNITALTNGCVFSFKSDNIITDYATFKSTNDVFLYSSPMSFQLQVESGADSCKGTIIFDPAVIIRTTGTFASLNDYFKVVVNDNLTTMTTFNIFVKGFYAPPGLY